MTIRRGTFGLVALGMAVLLAVSTGAVAAPGASASAAKTITPKPSEKFEVAGGFLFDPIVRSGKFIVGEMFCVAVGTQVKNVTISKCYIVASNGKTYTTNPKSSPQGVVAIAKTLRNVPAINLTHCITATVKWKSGASETVHLSSAPPGQPKLPCKLG